MLNDNYNKNWTHNEEGGNEEFATHRDISKENWTVRDRGLTT